MEIKKSEIDNIVFISVYNTYLDYLRNHTFLGRISVEKAQIMNSWELKKLGFLEYEFTNPNYFQVFMQEEGLEPQIIKAKYKKFLRFKKPQGRKSPYEKIPGNIAFEKDGYIFAKMIRHPGFEGRHFIKNMFVNEELWSEFSEKVTKSLENLIEKRLKEIQNQNN